MSDWTEGYLTDVEYSHAYNSELNPLKVRLALLASGFSAPRFDTACELGFGQGLSINIHAAASTTRWWGTDFNPTQVGFARELGAASGVDVKLLDESFADFVHRSDLPDFDFIGLHGVWSWVSAENQAAITDFIRRRLKVRGVLYIGYNVATGWAPFAPIRHLMAEHAALAGAAVGGKLKTLEGTLDFIERLLATNPAYRRANPFIVDRFNGIKTKDPQYLVHEFLNGHWQPSYFTTMAEALAPARISFACSASYLELYDGVNFTAEQRALLQALPDGAFRQSVRDFVANRQFRRDYWIKGAAHLPPLDQYELLRAERVVLVSHRPNVLLKINVALGEVALQESVYAPILDLLADHQPRTIGEIADAMQLKNVALNQVVEAIVLLVGAGHLAAAQDEATTAKAGTHTRKLNDGILGRARSSVASGFLASPLTGGGIAAGRMTQIFLLARRQGRKTAAELAQFAWNLLDIQGQKVIKDAKALETAEANIAELTVKAAGFLDEQLPILTALQVD